MSSLNSVFVLIIGQDNLFDGLPDVGVDHLTTGQTITPHGHVGALARRQLAAVLARLLSRKYDLIALPAIDFGWCYDASRAKKAIRRIVSVALHFKPTSYVISRLLSLRARNVIVLDRYDTHNIMQDFLRCLPCVSYYFKTNLLEPDDHRLFHEGRGSGCRFEFLPYWIAIDNYQLPLQRRRQFDVFFAGMVNSEERRASIETLRRLEVEGYRIKIAEQRLPFGEYLSLMSRSWLTLSPQGYGYNGFRHYESMLVGSVPLINRSEPPIVNDLRHGENCFLYSLARGDLKQIITNALSDQDRLLQMASGLRAFVIEQHSRMAVGRYLLRQVLPRAAGHATVQDTVS